MSKGRKGRSPDQIRKDRAEIARLYLRGATQAEIGRHLGLSRQQVGYDLAAVREEWKQSALMDFHARKAEELARIDQLEREYWDAWEASKRERQTSTTEQATGGAGERFRANVRKVEQTGDPRYLAGVQWCIEQRCKVLGLNAPTETRLTGKDGAAIQTENVVVLTDEQRAAALANLLARVGLPGAGPPAPGPAGPAGPAVGGPSPGDDRGGPGPGPLAADVAPLPL